MNLLKNRKEVVVLVFLLLTLNIFHTFFSVSMVDYEQVNVWWVWTLKKESQSSKNYMQEDRLSASGICLNILKNPKNDA